MEFAFSILENSFISPVNVYEYNSDRLQVVCPCCYEPVFKVVRNKTEYFSHYSETIYKDMNKDSVCELRHSNFIRTYFCGSLQRHDQSLVKFHFILKMLIVKYLNLNKYLYNEYLENSKPLLYLYNELRSWLSNSRINVSDYVSIEQFNHEQRENLNIVRNYMDYLQSNSGADNFKKLLIATITIIRKEKIDNLNDWFCHEEINLLDKFLDCFDPSCNKLDFNSGKNKKPLLIMSKIMSVDNDIDLTSFFLNLVMEKMLILLCSLNYSCLRMKEHMEKTVLIKKQKRHIFSYYDKDEYSNIENLLDKKENR